MAIDKSTGFSVIAPNLVLFLFLFLCFFLSVASAEKAVSKKKSIPIIVPTPKEEESSGSTITDLTSMPGKKSETGVAFQELNFNKTLVIEGRVEKPQVQFTLLKELPPEKEIKFEASFMQNILKMDRENTFKIKEAIQRE